MSTNLLMDQNHIALPGIEHLPMDDGLVADAADMSVLEESIQMMRTRQRLCAEPSHNFFLKTSIFHLDWLLHVAQIQVRSLTKCSVNVRDVSLHGVKQFALNMMLSKKSSEISKKFCDIQELKQINRSGNYVRF